MNMSTILRRLCLSLCLLGVVGTAQAQRTVTLRLNTATLPDTLQTTSLIKVMGAVDTDSDGAFEAPVTLPDGNVISWSTSGADESTLNVENVGGDYWRISFQVDETDSTQFKFFSQQAEAAEINGWEADPNPILNPGAGDTTLALHFFESQTAFQSFPPQDKGPYDWRPYAQKEDSVAVWFRVYAHTEGGLTAGYDPEGDATVGVRGDPLGGAGPLDWGTTKVTLQRELADDTKAGYHLFSGVAYYPQTAAGETQPYKFFVSPSGWEDGIDNRTFTVPQSDTTLHWVYFANSAPVDASKERKTANVVFTVDVTPLEEVGVYDRARGDTMIVMGEFNQWTNCLNAGNPDACSLFEDPFAPGVFSNVLPVTHFVEEPLNYKFFSSFNFEGGPSGWEEPLDYGGGNRAFVFTGEEGQDLGTQFFNSIRPGNLIPEGQSVEVTFQVDMTDALNFGTKEVFDPATDRVTVVFEDPVWIYTQTQNKGVDELEDVVLTDTDGDMIYTGTYTVVGPTYNGIGYRYHFGTEDGTKDVEEGSGGFDPGRRRYQYVLANEDGTMPAAYTMPTVIIQETGLIEFECNPTADVSTLPESVQALCYPAGTQPRYTAVEPTGGELPSEITLGANYPNPFNPTTTFEYSIPETQHVRVRVYDMLGRVVATLVDGVQTASTYQVTFEASDLASGVYLYQLETSNRILAQKMLLMK